MRTIACDITQVGNQWFKVEILEPIAGSLSHYIIGEVEAYYTSNQGSMKWTMKGEGSRKYRNQIIDALEEHLKFEIHG